MEKKEEIPYSMEGHKKKERKKERDGDVGKRGRKKKSIKKEKLEK